MRMLEQNKKGKKLLMTASRVSHIRQFHLPYLQWFQEHGWQVSVVSQGRAELPYVDAYEEFIFSKKNVSLENIRTIFKLAQKIRRENYELVISHATLANFITKLAVVFSGRRTLRYVAVSHGYLLRKDKCLKNTFYLLCEKIFRKRLNYLLTMNGEDYQFAKKYNLCRKIVQIPGMGVCPEKLPIMNRDEKDQKRQYFFKQWGIKEGQFLFLCVGEFSARKNQQQIIKAFANIVKTYSNVTLLFAGEGEWLPFCMELARKFSCERQIIFLGQRDDISELLQCCCDALVTASKSEGLPFAVMEALYCGCPVLASAVKGHTDLIQNGVNGYLFPSDDLSELEKTWCHFLEEAEKWKNRCIRLSEVYLIDKVMPQVLSYYLGDDDNG